MNKGNKYRFGHKSQNGTEARQANKDADANRATVNETRTSGKTGSKQAKTGATRNVSAPTSSRVPKAAERNRAWRPPD